MRVSTETAEAVLQRMLVAGNQLPANCTRSTASILAGVPEFNQIKSSWFPNRLMEQWGQIPGVSTRRLYETDDPDRFKALAALVPSLQSF
jgi:hypothetical protein